MARSGHVAISLLTMKLLLTCVAACAAFSSLSLPHEKAARPSTGDEVGTVRGKATFVGEAPKRRKVDMGSDKTCQGLHTEPLREESVIVGEKGELANVFVWVSKGLEGKSFEPPKEPVLLEQKGCCYVPHVLGLQVGQKLVIKNTDPLTHNVHSFAKKNKSFNQSQQAGGKELEQVFDKEEVLMPLKCDIHGWMSTYVGVVEHPFFAVTKADGTFEIPGLPPGEYTLSAKHEALGLQKASVTVTAGGVLQSDFSFKEE